MTEILIYGVVTFPACRCRGSRRARRSTLGALLLELLLAPREGA
jgi:hypothetical protein